MKSLATFQDLGSTPSRSTQAEGKDLFDLLEALQGGGCRSSLLLGGPVMVSIGLIEGDGDIRKAITVTTQNINAKDNPKVMAATA